MLLRKTLFWKGEKMRKVKINITKTEGEAINEAIGVIIAALREAFAPEKKLPIEVADSFSGPMDGLAVLTLEFGKEENVS